MVPKVAIGKNKINISNASFAENATLKGHIASVHEKKKPLKCMICDLRFAGKGSLKTHVAVVQSMWQNVMPQGMRLRAAMDSSMESSSLTELFFIDHIHNEHFGCNPGLCHAASC